MPSHEVENASTTSGLPIAPSLAPVLAVEGSPKQPGTVDKTVVRTAALASILAAVVAVIAQVLTHLIGLITNIAFYGRFSFDIVGPAGNKLGLLVLLVPTIGGVIVGFMARYGSKAIRGHGIPEAMEQVLTNESKIPFRLTFLKPLSAAIAIGTGGPFGAEGPIIATGGAFGSAIGQLLPMKVHDRKTLLAAGAAAGMAATFGSPFSAVLLAIELLLFEYRARSLIPVALATVVATGVRYVFVGSAPVFAMQDVTNVTGEALSYYVFTGFAVGVLAIFVTRSVYWIEDAFEKVPIHWMWWPALGGLWVGIIGYFAPRTMGVGYDNIEHLLSGNMATTGIAILCLAKFLSWSVALGSGTSGGTLAPLLTVGGGLGSLIGFVGMRIWPSAQISPSVAALVGMAALFAGASRAVLASVIFAFETTRQPLGLLPLLGGCTAAYLVSCFAMPNTIMTEKIARRGVRVPGEYEM